MIKYVIRRILIGTIQIMGVVIVAFFALRLIPGDPALIRAGGYQTPAIIAAARASLGLDKPVPVQLLLYLKGLLSGDMGISFVTSNPVSFDLGFRIPVTLELIILSITGTIIIAVPLGVYQGLKPGSKLEKVTTLYGFLAGALPDFFFGLVMIFIFYYLLRLAPAPVGRIDPQIMLPPRITGSYLLDGILSGRLDVTISAAKQLVLPVLTLIATGAGPAMKMMRATMIQVLQSDYIHYANLIGLPSSKVRNYAIRNALPPVVTLIGISIGVLIGGAVLVETVFSLGGLGQYAVSSAAMADYNALLGFLIVACVGTLVALLLVDVLQAAIDPRIRY